MTCGHGGCQLDATKKLRSGLYRCQGHYDLLQIPPELQVTDLEPAVKAEHEPKLMTPRPFLADQIADWKRRRAGEDAA